MTNRTFGGRSAALAGAAAVAVRARPSDQTMRLLRVIVTPSHAAGVSEEIASTKSLASGGRQPPDRGNRSATNTPIRGLTPPARRGLQQGRTKPHPARRWVETQRF